MNKKPQRFDGKIFLVGLPGSGKTTMGLELGLHLTQPFIDLDQEIEKATGKTIVDIFSENGEEHFRQMEQEYLKKITESIPSFVMATGGGTPCFFDNIAFMNEEGETVFINTPIETIKRRLEKDSTRPLMSNNSLENLLSKRAEYYSQAKHSAATLEELIKLFTPKS